MAAFIKGHTKVGGRKKGDRNKPGPRQHAKLIFGDDFRAALLEEIRATPLEVMHAVMMLRVSKGDYDGALVAAEKAAPYCHARLTASEVKVRHSLAGRSDAELAADIEMIRQKLALATTGDRSEVGICLDREWNRGQLDTKHQQWCNSAVLGRTIADN
jgi:hypothetical protein